MLFNMMLISLSRRAMRASSSMLSREDMRVRAD
jgi:hypothetical protein